MRYWTLVWAELRRRPERTLFTVVALAVGFFLFGLLQGVNAVFGAAEAQSHANRLMVSGRFGNALPLAYLDRIQSVPGVRHVTWLGLLPAQYRDPKQPLMVLATEPVRFFSVLSEYETSDAAVDRLIHTRTGLIVLDTVAKRFGWKVGDQITLLSPVTMRGGNSSWTFDIVGLATCPGNPAQPPFAVMNYGYFDDNRAHDSGTVAWFYVHAVDSGRAVTVGRSIDALFANSAAPTLSQQESAFAAQAVSDIGDARWFTDGVILAVFFAMLFVTGNVLFESVRERTRELAVLKTLGYSDFRVFALVELEALALCLSGALAGLGMAAGAFHFVGQAMGDISSFLKTANVLPARTLLTGMGVALLLTCGAAALPAWIAKRLVIVAALRVRP